MTGHAIAMHTVYLDYLEKAVIASLHRVRLSKAVNIAKRVAARLENSSRRNRIAYMSGEGDHNLGDEAIVEPQTNCCPIMVFCVIIPRRQSVLFSGSDYPENRLSTEHY